MRNELLVRSVIAAAIIVGTTFVVLVALLVFKDIGALWGLLGYLPAAFCLSQDSEKKEAVVEDKEVTT